MSDSFTKESQKIIYSIQYNIFLVAISEEHWVVKKKVHEVALMGETWIEKAPETLAPCYTGMLLHICCCHFSLVCVIL